MQVTIDSIIEAEQMNQLFTRTGGHWAGAPNLQPQPNPTTHTITTAVSVMRVFAFSTRVRRTEGRTDKAS